MRDLTVRVAWHQDGWAGRVCNNPMANPYCVMLERVRQLRDDEAEMAVAGLRFDELDPTNLPACIVESGGFMSPRSWAQRFTHPYRNVKKAAATHAHLKPTMVTVPE